MFWKKKEKSSLLETNAIILGYSRLFLTVVIYAFIVIYSLLLIPVSIVYLIIISVIEAITHGYQKHSDAYWISSLLSYQALEVLS